MGRAAEAGEHRERHDVRRHLDHVRAHGQPQPLHAELERVGGAEEQARQQRAERHPAADDDGGERQVAAAIGHGVGEGADLLEREHGAAHTGQRPATGDREHADAERVGAAGKRGGGILADSAQREPRPRAHEEHVDGDGGDGGHVGEHGLAEEHRPEHGQ